MTKKIDLNKSVFELTQEYPELINIMEKLGFKEITKKSMLHSVGKIMTIPKGAKINNISMMNVITSLMDCGFEITGEMPDSTFTNKPTLSNIEMDSTQKSRTEQIKSYLKRLSAGESLDAVRTDFVREFEKVEPSEIIKAEQELLNEGTPLSEVQRLCDVHSALFHGLTTEEKFSNDNSKSSDSNYRKRAEEALAKLDSFPKRDYSNKNALAAEMERIKGHPLHTLSEENKVLSNLITEFNKSRDESILAKICELSVHYAKKGDLIYPLLKEVYGISGPSNIMWTTDDELRDELSKLMRENERGKEWNSRIDIVLNRAKEMIYKEQNILFPICAVNFTKDEWYGIYYDSKDYDICFDTKMDIWDEAENSFLTKKMSNINEKIEMPGGHLTIEQLTALLNTIPIEITFVDEDNINRYFNEGHKVFKRPTMALDREVFSCHPPKIEPMVRQIIDDFRNNRRDTVTVWMEKGGHTMLVKYMAVRDKTGKYVGTAEFVQDMEFAKEHFFSSRG